jgi:hypothetical protein
MEWAQETTSPHLVVILQKDRAHNEALVVATPLVAPSVSSHKAEEEETRRQEKKDVKKKEKGKGKKMMWSKNKKEYHQWMEHIQRILYTRRF